MSLTTHDDSGLNDLAFVYSGGGGGGLVLFYFVVVGQQLSLDLVIWCHLLIYVVAPADNERGAIYYYVVYYWFCALAVQVVKEERQCTKGRGGGGEIPSEGDFIYQQGFCFRVFVQCKSEQAMVIK